MLYKNKILKPSFVTFYDPLAWKWSRSYSYSPAEHTGPKKSACTCIIIRINWARRNNKKIKSTHTHTHLMALCPGLPEWDSTREVKPIWILLKQETVSGSGINWAIFKSAPLSREITTPTPHSSVFYRPDALPVAQPTASKHWRQEKKNK